MDRPLYYKLVDGKAVPCASMAEAWTQDRVLAQTKVRNADMVSTVFLAIDHGHGYTAAPILFETMVFGGKMDQEMWRYCTWEEAEAGHRQVCRMLNRPRWCPEWLWDVI